MSKQTTTKTAPAANTTAAPAPAPATSTEVKVVQGGTLAAAAGALDFESDAGRGLENAGADDIAIPFLAVLQKGSPQCDPDQPGEYMPDAKPGMFFNTLTRALYDGKEKGVYIVPCFYERKWLRWTPRERGGGFKGEVSAAQVAAMRAEGRLVEVENRLLFKGPDGAADPKRDDKVSDTRVHYILFLDQETGIARMMVMSLGSTQIKKSRMLNALLSDVQFERADGSRFNPATWANVVRATTVGESNEKGSWSGVRFEIVDRVKDPGVYAMGKTFNAMVAAGRANVNFAQAEGGGAGGGGEGDERF